MGGESESALFGELSGDLTTEGTEEHKGDRGVDSAQATHGKMRYGRNEQEKNHAFLRDKILKVQGKSFPQARDVQSTLTEKIHSYRIAASEGPIRSMVKGHDESTR